MDAATNDCFSGLSRQLAKEREKKFKVNTQRLNFCCVTILITATPTSCCCSMQTLLMLYGSESRGRVMDFLFTSQGFSRKGASAQLLCRFRRRGKSAPFSRRIFTISTSPLITAKFNAVVPDSQ